MLKSLATILRIRTYLKWMDINLGEYADITPKYVKRNQIDIGKLLGFN